MIYICIPTHNEQQTVGVILWKLRQVLTDFPRDYQLLVADDGSTDKTPEVLEPYTRVLPLTVIRSDERKGSAASLELLLREAVRRSEYPKRDAIVTLQADFSEEPDDLVPLVKRLEAGADVAVGNKVSTSRETRARRFARSLARFFMRRQKWPEGVMTPFDGYRAYRLYAVKRAMEERGTSRLIRHEGWAGHAELLQAVLPHSRRVDVVDVDDRPDRLQRPRREKPFAAAMQVRVMASGMEPPGLLGVDELDRIALTASRSRERAATTPRSLQAGRSRTNGSRTRQQAGRPDQSGRTRSQSNGTGRSRPDASDPRPRRDRSQQAEPRARRKGTGQPRSRPDESSSRQPRSEETAAAKPDEPTQPIDAVAEGTASDAVPRPRRKRRRRKRGGQGRNAGAAQDQNAARESGGQSADPSASRQVSAQEKAGQPQAARQNDRQASPAAADGAPTHSGAPGDSDSTGLAGGSEATGGAGDSEATGGAADSETTGGKKRRRRGGRRGGRGRRRPRPADGGDAGAAAESTPNASTEAVEPRAAEAAAGAVEPRAAETAARAEND